MNYQHIVEIETLPKTEFYPKLLELVKERISDLKEDIQNLQNIERARGMFPYERGKYNQNGRLLSLNEDFMIFFDPKYTKLQ